MVKVIPAYLVGQGSGGSPPESSNWDIQTCCPEAVEEHGLRELRLGDIVALRDILSFWGRGYYKGAITIGVIVHGASDYAGHGPGVDPILSSKDGKIVPKIDPKANIAYYLGLRKPPEE